MDYALVKSIHVGAAALSLAGFVGRGLGALAGAEWVGSRAARTLPHVVDTVLLGSALVLAWTIGRGAAESSWLWAKVVALLVYIGLGMVALRPRTTPPLRATAFLGALAVFAYIVAVATTKNARGWLAFW